MKELSEILDECKISYNDIEKNYSSILNEEINRLEKADFILIGVSSKSDSNDVSLRKIGLVISNLQNPEYIFADSEKEVLSNFVRNINSHVGISNRLNNFKEGTLLENGTQLHLFELFNSIKKSGKFSDLNFVLNDNLKKCLPHLFSVIKHFQNPSKYPFYFKFWKNITREIFKENADDYDSLSEFYVKSLIDPSNLCFAAYMGSIGKILAKKLNENNIIKNENDKVYKHVRNKILNVDYYFDMVISYKNAPSGFVVLDNPSKYKPNIPLNTILYGPPGTGKTYNSINKAISIVNSNFPLNQDRNIVKDEYDKLEKDKKIFFSTFHQSMSYEDFIEGIKPSDPKDGESLSYGIKSGIFKIACARAAFLCFKKFKQSIEQSKPSYKFDDLYYDFLAYIKPLIKSNNFPVFKTISGKEVEIFEVNSQDSIKARAKGSKSTHVAPLTQENLEKLYNKFNSVSEIKNLIEVRDTVEVSPRCTEFYAVFNGIKQFEQTYKPDNSIYEEEIELDSTEEKDILKKYNAGIYNDAIKKFGTISEPVVLILDEINRGNVSQIFGELITLIEEDKRVGKSESLEVILPYSQSKFGVPPNLYLIGTMNTADRSVEALDTALRRRFVFEEILPKYNLPELQFTFSTVKGFEILQTINKRIEKLLNKDHLIGHSYFILKVGENANDKLINSFYKNIIPLLQEYFFGDYGKIGLVLGQGFVSLKNWDNKIDSFAKFEHESSDDFEYRDIYEIIDYRENTTYEVNNVKMDFEKAIKLLMKIDIA